MRKSSDHVNEHFKKEEVEILIDDKKYIIKNKHIKWTNGDASMHIIEDRRFIVPVCVLHSTSCLIRTEL